LQSHNLNVDSDLIDRDIEESNFDEFYTNSDRRVGGEEAINPDNLNRYEALTPALASETNNPSKKQTLEYLEYPSSVSPRPIQQGFQGLGQVSQDREFFQGFRPSSSEPSYRPAEQQSNRKPSQSLHQPLERNQYFTDQYQQRKSYEYSPTFRLDSQEMFQNNFNRLRRKPDTDTYFGDPSLKWNKGRNRNKRSPFKRIKIKIDNPFYFSNPSHARERQTESPRTRRQQAQPLNTNRFDSGPQGFWDDANFDTNFFERGHFESPDAFKDVPQQASPPYPVEDDQTRRLGYTAHKEPDYQNYKIDSEREQVQRPRYQTEDDRSNRRQQDRQQSVSVDKASLGGSQFANVRNYLEKEEENDILGSGNFYIETGGTFYDDDDDDPYSYSNHHSYNQHGNNFNNFRDFADIKEERLKGRRYRY